MTPTALSSDDRDATLLERRLARLREELADLAVPLPVDAPAGRLLLEEVDHARQPPVHEGRAPRYGALVKFGGVPRWDLLSAPTKLESAGTELGLLRRFADGRSSFVVRTATGVDGLVCFDRSLEFEATAVRLHIETGGYVVQRLDRGRVRVCGPDGVISWDGVQWRVKPPAGRHRPAICRLVPGIDDAVLDGLLELGVHWLSAGGVGATLVLALQGDPVTLGHLDLDAAIEVPRLSVAHREHLAPIRSVLGQMDRAALVDARGEVRRVGVGLHWSDHAEDLIDATGGMRHTSARRFSYDEPGALVFVVSEDGPVSVFSDGALVTSVRADPCQSGFPIDDLAGPQQADAAGEVLLDCPRCAKTLLVDEIRFDGWEGVDERLPCPVCDQPLVFDAYRTAIRGVRKSAPGAGGAIDLARPAARPAAVRGVA